MNSRPIVEVYYDHVKTHYRVREYIRNQIDEIIFMYFETRYEHKLYPPLNSFFRLSFKSF